jgi:small-conductance mechanosensitive channel/CRP-like cAMP-binding protein
MSTPVWVQPVLVAGAVAAGLETIYLLLRRQFPRLIDRVRYQLWVAAVAVTAWLSAARATPLLAPSVEGPLLAGAGFVAVVLGVDLLYRLVDRYLLARRLDERGRPAIPQLVRDLGAWIAVAIGIVVGAAWFFDADPKGLALPSAVVSAVLGFALQDVLKNVFAGLALQTEQPFDIGDWIVIDGEARQVLEMSWRSTHLRNNLGVEFREPNANLVVAEVVNYGSGLRPVGLAVQVGVAYSAPPRLVKDSLVAAAREAPGVIIDPAPAALVVGFGDSAVQYEVRFWTREVDGLARMRDAVMSRIWYRLQRDGWSIPFPIRTVQLELARAIQADKRSWRTARAEKLLARTDLFAALAPEVRSRLAEAAELGYYDAGERLVVEGEAGDSLMLLSRGSVAVTKAGGDLGTTSISLAVLGEGAYFGEMSLLTGAPRSATITAEGAVEVFVLDREALEPILAADPAIAETLSKVLAERMAATAARFEDRREALRRTEISDHQTLLKRIRSFFRLGHRSDS